MNKVFAFFTGESSALKPRKTGISILALLVIATLIMSSFLGYKLARAATLTLTPALGVAGQEIVVTATGLDNSSLVTFTWDGAALTTNPASVTTTAGGALPANVSFVVPSATLGTHIVRVSTGASVFSTATFTINTPTVAVTSPAGAQPIGRSIVVAGTNFEANKSTTVKFDSTTVATVTSTVSGSFEANFNIPDINNTGTHIINASNSAYAVANVAMTLATPVITLDPTTAIPGSDVIITGANFRTNSPIIFRANGAILDMASTVVSDGTGSFTGIFTVPTLLTGSATIEAESSVDLYDTAILTIPAPTLTLSPATASPGSKVSVTGTYFKAESTIVLTVNGDTITPDDSPLIVNSQGGFVTTFTIPTLPSGASTVKAAVSDNDASYATATLTTPATAITITPATGTDNLTVFVNGTGFDVDAPVTFFANGTQISNLSVTTTSLGTFATPLKIPGGIPSGAITIRARTSAAIFANATFTISAAAVAVSPTAGSPGTRVVLTGTNFDPNLIVSFKWNGKILPTIEPSVVASSAGSFTANIIVPSDYVSGSNQIEVSTSSTSTILVTFVIANPTITLGASSGNPGAKISITGSNFEGNKALTLKWDDQDIESDPSVITTTPLGGFYGTFTVPADAKRGVHYISVAAGKQIIQSTVTFTVNIPTLTLNSTSNAQSVTNPTQLNNKIIVAGAGFSPSATVSFSWDGIGTLTTEPEEVTTESQGSFLATVIIQTDSSVGTHTLIAKTSDNIIATLNFSLTAASLSLSKIEGVSNSLIQLAGINYSANSEIQVYWDEEQIEDGLSKTDGIGGLVASFRIPESQPGIHVVKASTGQYALAQADFTIISPATTISPSNPTIGSKVLIRGSGFSANQRVALKNGNWKLKTNSGVLMTDANGNFSTLVKVPLTFASSMLIHAQTNNFDAVIATMPINSPFYLKIIRILVKMCEIGIAIILFILFIRWIIRWISKFLGPTGVDYTRIKMAAGWVRNKAAKVKWLKFFKKGQQLEYKDDKSHRNLKL